MYFVPESALCSELVSWGGWTRGWSIRFPDAPSGGWLSARSSGRLGARGLATWVPHSLWGLPSSMGAGSQENKAEGRGILKSEPQKALSTPCAMAEAWLRPAQVKYKGQGPHPLKRGASRSNLQKSLWDDRCGHFLDPTICHRNHLFNPFVNMLFWIWLNSREVTRDSNNELYYLNNMFYIVFYFREKGIKIGHFSWDNWYEHFEICNL